MELSIRDKALLVSPFLLFLNYFQPFKVEIDNFREVFKKKNYNSVTPIFRATTRNFHRVVSRKKMLCVKFLKLCVEFFFGKPKIQDQYQTMCIYIDYSNIQPIIYFQMATWQQEVPNYDFDLTSVDLICILIRKLCKFLESSLSQL